MQRALSVFTLLFFANACFFDNGSSGSDPSAQASGTSVKSWAEAMYSGAQKGAVAHDAAIDAVRIASGNYLVDLSVDPAPAEAVEPYWDAFDALALAQADALSASVTSAIIAAEASKRLPGGEGDEQTELRQMPLAFTLIVGAGIAITGWLGYKGVKKAGDERAKPVESKIQAANEAELAIVKSSLKLPPETSREATLDHFKKLGIAGKGNATRNIEGNLANAAIDDPQVTEVDTLEVRKSVAKSAVTCGETAVTTTVSLSTAATGGQGYTEAMQAVGLSAKVAATTDLAISVVSAATDTPLQPLDVLASSLDVKLVSKQTAPVTVPSPAKRVEPAAAKGVLGSASASAQEQDDAAASLVLTMVDAYGDDLEPVVAADGAVTIEAPLQVHQSLFADPTAEQAVLIPQMPSPGGATMVIAAAGMVPVLYEDINTYAPVAVDYPAIRYEDLEQPEPEPEVIEDVPETVQPDGYELWCQGEGEWACDENDCITDGQICDGVQDCSNGVDEGDFCNGTATGCDADEFDCADGDLLEPGVECIPDWQHCDGDVDCFLSDQDEVGCE